MNTRAGRNQAIVLGARTCTEAIIVTNERKIAHFSRTRKRLDGPIPTEFVDEVEAGPELAVLVRVASKFTKFGIAYLARTKSGVRVEDLRGVKVVVTSISHCSESY